jgi:integrase
MNETEEGTWDEQRLISEREEDVKTRSYAFEHKLVEFYNWLKEQHPNFSDWTRKSYLKAIRSFFAFHRLDVKFTQQQKSKVGKKPKPKRKYYEYTLDDIKRMAEVSNPRERYILLAGKELGLRASDFVKLKQRTFVAHDLDGEVPVSLGELYTFKEGVSAKPFLGFDGREAVKQWLTVLKSQGIYNQKKPCWR